MYQRATPHVDIPEYDPVRKEHFWLVSVGYRINNPEAVMAGEDTPHLDRENRVAVTPAMCLHCEQIWTRRLHYRKCAGDPS